MTAWESAKSRAAYKILRDEHAVGCAGSLTYRELGDALGVPPQSMGRVLRVVQERCHERGWPTITVFVVRRQTGLPGGGCDVVTPGDVERATAAVRATAWPAEAWW